MCSNLAGKIFWYIVNNKPLIVVHLKDMMKDQPHHYQVLSFSACTSS